MLDYVQTGLQVQGHHTVRLDRSRDELLTEAGQALLRDQYLLPGEGCQDLFARVASHYGDDEAHAQRLYDYMSRLWFMPSGQMLSNSGTARGLPVSCFLNGTADNLHGVLSLWNEYARLEPKEGSGEVRWDNLRPIGPKDGPEDAAAPISAMRVMDSLTQAITGSPLQRGSAAAYLPVSHPEIEEFTDLRHAPDQKAPRIHHGILVTDAFMRAVEVDGPWALTSPASGAVVRAVGARVLWQRILAARAESGEPCLVFSDHVNTTSWPGWRCGPAILAPRSPCRPGWTSMDGNARPCAAWRR
jgi:ribonucleoside-diphosphate reductase alpha chain